MLRSGVQCWDASVRPTARVESLTVLLAACSLLCSERYIAESLFRHTRSVGWQTPRSSEALQAKKQIDEAFPRRIAGTILMAVEAPRNGTVLCREVEDFVANVSSKVTSDERVQQYKPHVLSYWTELGDIPSSVMSRKDFISADERMTLLLIQPTKIPENHDFAKANDFLQDFCSSPPLGFNLHITGAPALLTGSGCSSNSHAVVNPRDMSFKCLFFAEVITTPIALLIMGCIVRHWRLLILPLFTVCLSFAVSALMLIPWMDHVEVPTDAIAAMGSVILALSLDYSLFLLSRFSENHHDKFTLQENVDIIKACTCRTISISGLLVAIAFFAGILLPERNLQGTCIALGFAVLACVATNVVFLPAVFLAFGPVFVGRSFLPSWWGDVQLDDGAEEEDERQRPGPKSADNTNWLLIMRVVERAPLSAILLVLLFVWPVLSAAPSLHITADRFAMMPLYSPAVLALRKIQDAKLSTGLVNPYEILVTAPNQPRDVLRAELSKGLDSLGLATSHLGLGMSDLQKTLREGQNSLLRRPEAPEDLSGYEELLNGLACANRTESSPHNPHCNCCPNAFLECEECDLAATCASPEMQALLELAKEGNLTVDDSQLRSLKVCIERAAVAAGVVRILQNRQRANKGALPMSELENEFKELWKVPFNVKQANENDPVEFLRKWPSKVEIVPQGDSFLVQLAKKPVAKAAPEEPAAAVPPAAVPPAAVPPAAVPPAAEPAEAKNGPAKPPGQKPPQNIQDFLWNLHTLLHARGGIPIAQLKDVYLTHFGHKCAIERFLVVAEGGLLATFKRIPHIIQIDKEPDHMLRPSLPGGATREELLAEDEKYRKSLQQKMAAKAGAAKAAETPKAPSPEGPTGDKKHDNETLQRMLIQGVIRVLQNRAKEGKGPLPLADLEKEFEAAWKVPFNCQQAGERDAVQFLQKWNTKVDVYQENGHDVVALAKKPHEKAKATAVKAPPAKAGSTASAPSPEASQRADVDLFGRPLGATPSLPELTETAKGMLQNMKDLVVQQEALVKALTSLQK